jgi:CBS domain-containing protein
MVKVRDIMTRKVIALEAQASRGEAESALTRQSIGGAPVVDREGKLVGFISKSDLVGPPAEWIRGEGTVADFMTPDVVSVYDDEPVHLACEVMLRRGVHRVLVIDGEGSIVGILSSMDVVRAVASGARFNLPDDDGEIEEEHPTA